MEGRVSSVQSMGAVDGPGLRYVVFLQGAAAVGFVLRFRGELDVAKDEVCVLENLLGTGKVAGAGGIERGVDVVFMQAPE